MMPGKIDHYLSDAHDSLLCARIELKNDPSKWVIVNDLMQKIQAIKGLAK
jgi:hypothetical protein